MAWQSTQHHRIGNLWCNWHRGYASTGAVPLGWSRAVYDRYQDPTVGLLLVASRRLPGGPIRRYKDSLKTDLKTSGTAPRDLMHGPLEKSSYHSRSHIAVSEFEESTQIPYTESMIGVKQADRQSQVHKSQVHLTGWVMSSVVHVNQGLNSTQWHKRSRRWHWWDQSYRWLNPCVYVFGLVLLLLPSMTQYKRILKPYNEHNYMNLKRLLTQAPASAVCCVKTMLYHSVLVLKDWAAETYWCRQLMMQTCCHIHHISMRDHNVTHIIPHNQCDGCVRCVQFYSQLLLSYHN